MLYLCTTDDILSETDDACRGSFILDTEYLDETCQIVLGFGKRMHRCSNWT